MQEEQPHPLLKNSRKTLISTMPFSTTSSEVDANVTCLVGTHVCICVHTSVCVCVCVCTMCAYVCSDTLTKHCANYSISRIADY